MRWIDAPPSHRPLILNVFASCPVYDLLIHIIVIIADTGLDLHYPATSSISVGSSSPVPVLLTRLDTGHMRRRSSAAALRSSVPASPFSHRLISALSSTTGMRS